MGYQLFNIRAGVYSPIAGLSQSATIPPPWLKPFPNATANVFVVIGSVLRAAPLTATAQGLWVCIF